MKLVVKWLEAKFSRSESAVVSKHPRRPVQVKPREVEEDEYTIETDFNSQVAGQTKSRVEARDVSIPDMYGNEYAPTVPDLEILSQSTPNFDRSTGFDPYDTVVLYRDSKS